MSRSLYGRAFVGGRLREGTLITIDESVISDVRDAVSAPPDASLVHGVILPGFIDVHVHGGDGSDFMDGSEEAVARVTAFHAAKGTTAVAATTLSASPQDLHAAVSAISRVANLRAPAAAEICGIHLEGPFINLARAGAQDPSSIRPADIHELTSLLDLAPALRWMVTLAPELAGARPLMEHFRDRVLFSVGHTAADYAEVIAALEWGASHFTHLFNAMTGIQHRAPGAVGAAFVSTEATAELIADGIHVHHAVLRIAALAMPNRIALISDAVRATGMPEGRYKIYAQEFVVSEGAARLANGSLAGSVLTMQQAVCNMVELAGLPLELVVPMATEVPARILKVHERKGKIAPGYDADLVVLSDRLTVDRVLVRGRELT